jgi:hypothetical protein
MLGSSLRRSGRRAGLRVNLVERLEDVRERLRLEPAAVRRAGFGVDAVLIGAVAEERAVGHESIHGGFGAGLDLCDVRPLGPRRVPFRDVGEDRGLRRTALRPGRRTR